MDYYCDVRDRTFEKKSKSKHLQSLTHYDLEKSLQTKYILQKPDFVDIDEIFIEYIINHK